MMVKVLILFICCFINLNVYADCSGGLYTDFYVSINNTQGAETYQQDENYKIKKTDVVIPDKTRVRLLYEHYSYFSDPEYYCIEYNGKEYYVHGDFLKTITGEEKKKPRYMEEGYYTLKDIEIRKGPSSLYEVTNTIKKGNYILADMGEYNFYDKYEEGGWIYVTNGSISGYTFLPDCIYCEDLTIAKELPANETRYYLPISYEDRGLKLGDKVILKYEILLPGYNIYVVDYNGRQINMESDELGVKTNNKFIVTNKKGFINDTKSTLTTFVPLKDKDKLDVKVDLDKLIEENRMYDIKYYNKFDDYYNFILEIEGEPYIYRTRSVDTYEIDEINSLIIEPLKEYRFDTPKYYGFNKKTGYNQLETTKSYTLHKVDMDFVYGREIYYNEKLGLVFDGTLDKKTEETKKEEVLTPTSPTSIEYIKYCLLGTALLSLISGILIIVINRKKEIK